MGYIKKYSDWNTTLYAIKESRDNAKMLDSLLNEKLKKEDFGKKLSGKEKRQAKRAKKKEGKAQKRAWKETEKRDVAKFSAIGNPDKLKMIKQKDNDPAKDSFKVVSQGKDTEFWGDDGEIKDHIFAWIANQVYNLAAKKNIVPDVSDPNERKEEALKLEAAVNVTKAKKGMLKDKIKFSVDWGDVEGLFYDEKDEFSKGKKKKKKKGKGDDDQTADATEEKDDSKFYDIVNKYRSHPDETLPLVKEMIKVRFTETPAVANRPGYHEMDDEVKFKELIIGLQKGFETDNEGPFDSEGVLDEDLVDHIYYYTTVEEELSPEPTATLGNFTWTGVHEPPKTDDERKSIADIITEKGLIEGWKEAKLPPIPEEWTNDLELNYKKPKKRSDEQLDKIQESLFEAIGKSKTKNDGEASDKDINAWAKEMKKEYGEEENVWKWYWQDFEWKIGKDGKVDYNAISTGGSDASDYMKKTGKKDKDDNELMAIKGLKDIKFNDDLYNFFLHWTEDKDFTEEEMTKYEEFDHENDTPEEWKEDSNSYFRWTLWGPEFIAALAGSGGDELATLESRSILSFNEFNNLNEDFDISAARAYWTPMSSKDVKKSSDKLSFSDIEKEGFKTQNEGDLFRDWVNKEGNEEIKKKADQAIKDELGKTDGLSEGGKEYSYDGDYIKTAWEEVGQQYLDEIQPADPIVSDDTEKEEVEVTIPTEKELIADYLATTEMTSERKKMIYDKYNLSDEQKKKFFINWWIQVMKGYDRKEGKYSGTDRDFSGKLDPPFIYKAPKTKETIQKEKDDIIASKVHQNIVVIHPDERDMKEKVTVNGKPINMGLRATIDPKEKITLRGDRIFGYIKRKLTVVDCEAAGGEWSHHWTDDEAFKDVEEDEAYNMYQPAAAGAPNTQHPKAHCMIKGDPDKTELVIGNYIVKTGTDIQDLRSDPKDDIPWFDTEKPLRFISSKDLVNGKHPEGDALAAAIDKMKEFTTRYEYVHAGKIKTIIPQKDLSRTAPRVSADHNVRSEAKLRFAISNIGVKQDGKVKHTDATVMDNYLINQDTLDSYKQQYLDNKAANRPNKPFDPKYVYKPGAKDYKKILK